MQLKKNPREGQYQDPRVPQFEAEDEATMEEGYEERAENSRVSRRQPEAEATEPAPPVRAPARQESLVDAHSTFDGRYETDQDLRISGTISGEVVCRGLLTIEQEATARARIQTRDAQIRGRLEGDIVCSGKLTLAATSVVSGTLKAATFVVEEGATLNGTVETAAVPLANLTAPQPAQEPAAPAPQAPAASSSRQGPNWSGERERKSAAASGETAPATGTRNGRQAPTFAFVPSSEERGADRN